MSATNTFETGLLNLIFTNTALANIGDASGLQPSATASCLWVSILTAAADGEAGTVTEANYGAYARVGLCRSAAGWTVSSNNASNTAAVTFPAATSGTNCACYFGVHTASVSGTMLLYGTITTPLAISIGITPEFAAGQLDINLD